MPLRITGRTSFFCGLQNKCHGSDTSSLLVFKLNTSATPCMIILSAQVPWHDILTKYCIHECSKLLSINLSVFPLTIDVIYPSNSNSAIIVSRADWLGKPANFRGACYCFRVVTWYWPCTVTTLQQLISEQKRSSTQSFWSKKFNLSQT